MKKVLDSSLEKFALCPTLGHLFYLCDMICITQKKDINLASAMMDSTLLLCKENKDVLINEVKAVLGTSIASRSDGETVSPLIALVAIRAIELLQESGVNYALETGQDVSFLDFIELESLVTDSEKIVHLHDAATISQFESIVLWAKDSIKRVNKASEEISAILIEKSPLTH